MYNDASHGLEGMNSPTAIDVNFCLNFSTRHVIRFFFYLWDEFEIGERNPKNPQNFIPKATVQRYLQENNRNITAHSHY